MKIWEGSRGFVPGSLVFCLDGRMEIPCRVDGGLLPVAANDAAAPLVLRLSAKDSAVPYGRAEWMTILPSIGEGVVGTSVAGELRDAGKNDETEFLLTNVTADALRSSSWPIHYGRSAVTWRLASA